MLRIPIWLSVSQSQRRSHEQAFFASITNGFGIHIERNGALSTMPGTLYIMNHISWADIPVMLSILDADFVAKSDMIDWPIIGCLARRFKPVFVARNEQHRSHAQADAIRARLHSGRSVILCPEGTTSDGTSILPFRTSLFAAADAAAVIQPVILRYLQLDGTALPPARQREVAWIDDDDLLPGATRFAKYETMARVELLPPVIAMGNRKVLAENIRQLMLTAYAAAPNRPI